MGDIVYMVIIRRINTDTFYIFTVMRLFLFNKNKNKKYTK